MPATAFALRLEQAYLVRQRGLWQRVLGIVLNQYRAVDPGNLAPALRSFIDSASATIELGQQEAQQLAAAFLTQYVETETGRAFRAAPVAADVAGTTRDGSTIGTALAGATGVIALLLSQGRPRSEALARGGQFAGIVASTAVPDAAWREQAHQAEQSRGLMPGWTWVTSGTRTCPACLSQQDGRTRPSRQGMSRHAGCDCVQSPVLTGVSDTVQRPTGQQLFDAMTPEQQVAVFKNAGEEKAAAIRDGTATLADFVASRQTTRGGIVTEAPLTAVV